MPSELIDGVGRAGAVLVMYGTEGGLPAGGMQTRSEIWHQNSPGVAGSAAAYDYFGSALASGDIHDDGCDDLVIGVPGKDVNGIQDAGAIVIIYGSPTGLTAGGSQEWHADSPGVAGAAEAHDSFGMTLAMSPDRSGDGMIAIGVPYEDVGAVRDAGAVVTLPYRFFGGVSATESREWTEDSSTTMYLRSPFGLAWPVPGVAEEFDNFGLALTFGDIDCDGLPDLAVGIPNEDVGTAANAGAVTVLYAASVHTLTAVGSQHLYESHSFLPGVLEAGDRFGASVAFGNFEYFACRHPFAPDDGYGYGTLVVGVPGQNTTFGNTGAVRLLYGSSTGLASSGIFDQSTWGIGTSEWVRSVGPREPDDYFGERLAVGDFNADGLDDLVIGVPREDLSEVGYSDWLLDAGSVVVVHGRWYAGLLGYSGSLPLPSQQWTQDSTGVADTAHSGDEFGAAVAVLDLNGDDYDDVVIGVPGEGANVGGIHVLYGSEAGLRPPALDQVWNKDGPNIVGDVQNNDYFGDVLETR